MRRSQSPNRREAAQVVPIHPSYPKPTRGTNSAGASHARVHLGRDGADVPDVDVLAAVREAIITSKSEVVTLQPEQIQLEHTLAEPPIFLDSIEFVEMVTYLENALGLPAEDDHIAYRAMRTVGDVVDAVGTWIADDASSGA